MKTARKRKRFEPRDLAVPIAVGALALGLAGCPGRNDGDAGDVADVPRPDAADVQVDVPVDDPGMDVVVDTGDPDAADTPDVPDMAMPDPAPSMVAVAADCGAAGAPCRRPMDAVPNAAGTVIFFTGYTTANQPAIFSVPAMGGAITTVFSGAPLSFPVSIAISDDDGTLYVADAAADGPDQSQTGRGGVFSIPAGGGMATRVATLLMAGMNNTALIGPQGVAVRGDDLVVTARSAAMPTRPFGFFTVPRAGGMATLLVEGAELVDPTDVAITSGGVPVALDTGRGVASGRVARGASPLAFPLGGLVAAFPGGIAASRDGQNLLVAGWTPGATNRLTWVRADGTMPMPIANPSMNGIVSPTGIGRARNAAVYAVADELGGTGRTGAVFVVR